MISLIRKIQKGIQWAKGSIKAVKTIESLFVHLGNFSDDLDKIWGLESEKQSTPEEKSNKDD